MSTDLALARAATVAANAPQPSARADKVAEPGVPVPAPSRDALAHELTRATANTGLTFRLDEVSHRTVVTVLDRNSGEILRQIPGEVALRIARELERKGFGLIRDTA